MYLWGPDGPTRKYSRVRAVRRPPPGFRGFRGLCSTIQDLVGTTQVMCDEIRILGRKLTGMRNDGVTDHAMVIYFITIQRRQNPFLLWMFNMFNWTF